MSQNESYLGTNIRRSRNGGNFLRKNVGPPAMQALFKFFLTMYDTAFKGIY